MSEANNRTIESYDGHVQEYIDGTPQEVSGEVKEWLDKSLTDLPKEAQILEFGSAFGRDATYLQSMGYAVECTDATSSFVDLLQAKGFNARQLNAITDDLPQGLDYVLANAVLLHLTREETAQVLSKIHASLNEGGRFAFTLKDGEGEEWSEAKLGAPRYFCYWTQEQIGQYLSDAGFDNVDITGGVETKNATWLQVIAKK